MLWRNKFNTKIFLCFRRRIIRIHTLANCHQRTQHKQLVSFLHLFLWLCKRQMNRNTENYNLLQFHILWKWLMSYGKRWVFTPSPSNQVLQATVMYSDRLGEETWKIAVGVKKRSNLTGFPIYPGSKKCPKLGLRGNY